MGDCHMDSTANGSADKLSSAMGHLVIRSIQFGISEGCILLLLAYARFPTKLLSDNRGGCGGHQLDES